MNHETQQSAVRHDEGASPLERANRLSLAVAFSFPALRRGCEKVRLLLGQVFGKPKGPDLDLPPHEGLVHRSVHQDFRLERDARIRMAHEIGATQKEIAEEVGLSQARVSQIIRGKK